MNVKSDGSDLHINYSKSKKERDLARAGWRLEAVLFVCLTLIAIQCLLIRIN